MDDSFEKIILSACCTRPGAEVTDILKLIYQSVYGCGHMVRSMSDARQLFFDELEATESNNKLPLFENVGNGYCRANFQAIKSQYNMCGRDDKTDQNAEIIFKFFLKTASEKNAISISPPNAKNSDVRLLDFTNRVELLCRMCRDGMLPYDAYDIEQFTEKWIREGCKPFSHSKKYRDMYRPAYRIVLEKYAQTFKIISDISKLKIEKEDCIVAIDGRCGSGKTSLAVLLSSFFNCDVIHMDDFFLPFDEGFRTKERFSKPGGNIHYERFNDEVVNGILSGNEFSFRVFDCSSGKYDRTKKISLPGMIIVEGSYSAHPEIKLHYDYRIFCDIYCDEQKKRITDRNGADMLEIFEKKWIPLEEEYFAAYMPHPEETFDEVFNSSERIAY